MQPWKWVMNSDISDDEWPREQVPQVEIDRDYPMLWRKLASYLPGLSQEQRRRIVSLMIDTCPHCFEDNHSCQCWNDE